MNAEPVDLWSRANKSLHAAQALVTEDSDSAASRAYYAAFHARLKLYFTIETYDCRTGKNQNH
jgi:uncharacterized protein (UPF0332 family)